MKIAVYCSSSDAVPGKYLQAAEQLGREMGEHGHTLIYGGASVGSMGAVARGVISRGGTVIGVMPEKLHNHGLAFSECDEIIITRTMRERKEEMETRGDAFIALPGGLGTLEEILEIMVLKQLGYHVRPAVLVNIEGFYSRLTAFFDDLCSENFMKPETREQYMVVENPSAALQYIESYKSPKIAGKWFSRHS